MATYYRGFDDADGISDFTEVEVTSGDNSPVWSVVSTNQVQATSAASDNAAFVWNDIDADGDRDDVEVLGQIYINATSTTQRWYALRLSTSGASRTGYAIRVRTASCDLYRFSGSTYTSIAGLTISVTSGTWVWIRFRINGTSLYAKYWVGAIGDEPGTWNAHNGVTDSTYSTLGHVGLLKGANTNTQLWRYFGVGTAGDTAPSSAGGGATITADGLTQGHSLGSPALTQANVLAVQAVAQSQSLDAPALTQHNVLAVNAIAQAHALGNVTLTQAHILTVQGIGQAHSLGAPSLTQHNALTPDALTQAQTLGNITLTIAGSIAAADIAQGHSLGTPALTQHNVLAVAALMQAHSLDQPALSQAGTLAVQNMTQAQVLDAVALVQHHALAVQALLQGHALGNITLTASDALAIDGLTHAQILGAPSLTQHNVLAVQNMTHAQILQAVTLGGLVIGSLRGTLVAYSLLDGEVVCRALLSGSLETVH